MQSNRSYEQGDSEPAGQETVAFAALVLKGPIENFDQLKREAERTGFRIIFQRISPYYLRVVEELPSRPSPGGDRVDDSRRHDFAGGCPP